MGEQKRESAADSADDLYDPVIGDFADEGFEEFDTGSSEKQRLLAKRRRAERRLEELRLREELGDYDLQFDDF
jgi:hypothetical protein